MAGLRIRVRGQVQGVGFRPFVWHLAQTLGLRGHVLNDPEGVLIEVWGDTTGLVAAIAARAPPLARVDAVETEALPGDGPAGFTIAASQGQGAETRVPPDAATCPDCAAEIRAAGRRLGYAFTNCTSCGPRFSIVTGLPYDRERTTMAAFPLCPACRSEYDSPSDRRFHAQPIACPACGPRLWFEREGAEIPGDPIALAAALVARGGIVALKGLGGFHLACDATDAQAVALLRLRKDRPTKPLAVMGHMDALDRVADLAPADRALLGDSAAPIVLVPSRGLLPDGVAPGMATLGVMLPATPLHHLLLDATGGVLVMTSGNPADAPQATGNAEARAGLAAIADGFLMHDRDIARRLDDSVERAVPTMVIRRGRGRVPGTFPLPPGFPDRQVLATGGQMKGAICLVKTGQALLSQHLGDLDDARCADAFDRAMTDCRALLDHRPEAVACDMHPQFHAKAAARATGLPMIEVQHHHAHLAACLGEAGWPRDGGPVAGIILDGLGLGDDGTLWGGEVLLGDYQRCTRLAHLRAAPLAGGDAASRQPWRNAVMRLDQARCADLADRLFAAQPRDTLRQAAAAGINAPPCSSAGRLFDAVAACVGLCPEAQGHEAEAAMRLEAIAGPPGEGYPFGAGLDPAPMFRALARDLALGIPPATIAARFHDGLAAAFAAPARAVIASGRARAVALSGGCLQNVRLQRALLVALDGLPVLTHRRIPANDGGLAFGQALVALARLG